MNRYKLKRFPEYNQEAIKKLVPKLFGYLGIGKGIFGFKLLLKKEGVRYTTMIKINCIWNDQGAWCKNEKIKRSLFGFGARCCIEHGGNKRCQFKKPWLKPTGPLPPPPPRPPKKSNKIEIIVKRNKELEKCRKENKKFRKEFERILALHPELLLKQ